MYAPLTTGGVSGGAVALLYPLPRYIVAQTAGLINGSMMQRPMTLVGSGSKLVRYYNMGPSYMFPGNSYSDGPASRYVEIAKVNRRCCTCPGGLAMLCGSAVSSLLCYAAVLRCAVLCTPTSPAASISFESVRVYTLGIPACTQTPTREHTPAQHADRERTNRRRDLINNPTKANDLIAKAEHVLWPARRQASEVAIVYFRSAQLWDQWHLPPGSPRLCLAGCVTSMVSMYIDYSVEVYGLYLALATDANIPVDFIDEDALEEPETLAKYKVIYVTQPNLPEAGARGLATWVKDGGGTLVTTSGAGVADAYDEPSTTLSSLRGSKEAPRPRIALGSDTDINVDQPTPLPSQNGTAAILAGSPPRPFTAVGVVGKAVPTGGGCGGGGGGGGSSGRDGGGGGAPWCGTDLLATFADGSPAITRNRGTPAVGKGAAVHFLWLPGLSYWFSNPAASRCPPGHTCRNAGRLVGDVNIQTIVADVARAAGVVAPVTTSERSVETPLMLTPDGTGAVVTLLNFKAGACTWPANPQTPVCTIPSVPSLALNVTVPFRPANVTSAEHGPLRFTTDASGGVFTVRVRVPLGAADFVLLERDARS